MICGPWSSMLALMVFLLMTTSTSQSGRVKLAASGVELGVGVVSGAFVSSKALVS